MELDTTSGLMVGHTQVIGKIIICMVRAFIHGKIHESTKVSTIMTKSMDMEFTHGRTSVSTKEVGTMVNNTEKVFIGMQTEMKSAVDGKMERELSGLNLLTRRT